jgi:TRAP-type mannitol/chloroaromatic compound transport system permease small subunit
MGKIDLVIKDIDNVSSWTGRIFSWTIIPLTLLVVFEVITRRVFNSPTIWSFEVITYLYGFFFMIVAAYTLLHNAHVRIDIVSSRWSPQTQAIVDIVNYLVFFFPFIGVVLWRGTYFALSSWSFGEVSASYFHSPLYPIKTVIPIAALLLLIQGLSNFVKNIDFVLKHRKHEP